MPLILFLAVCGAAASPAAVQLQVEVGLGGWVVPGAWTPVRVRLAARTAFDGRLIVSVPAEGTRGSTTYGHPVRLGAGAREQVSFDVLIQDPRRPLTVRIVTGEQEAARAEVPMGNARAAEGVVAALTGEPAGLEFLATGSRKLRPAYVDEEALPVRWQGYDSVVLLVIRDLDDRRILPAQRQALVEWVTQGGRILVIAGATLTVQQTPWLLELLPAALGEVTQAPVPELLRGVGGPVILTRLLPKSGAAVRPERGSPLIAQWHHGRGLVTVWAFDPFAASLRAWSARAALWQDLLGAPPVKGIASRDVATLLPQTRPLPGSAQFALALLSVLYILAVRAVLRRWGGSRGGWLAAALIVVVFGGVLYGFSTSARASATSVAQVTVLEAIPDTGAARATTYASLISPYGGTFRLQAAEGAAIRPVDRAPLTFFDPPREIGGAAPPGRLVFEVTQVVPLVIRGAVMVDAGGISVRIDNRTGLLIQDAVIYRDGQIYRIPDVAAQRTIQLDPARWEAVDRRGAFSPDLAAQARVWIFERLMAAERSSDVPRRRLWLVGRVEDDRTIVRMMPSRPGDRSQLLLVPFDVPRAP